MTKEQKLNVKATETLKTCDAHAWEMQFMCGAGDLGFLPYPIVQWEILDLVNAFHSGKIFVSYVQYCRRSVQVWCVGGQAPSEPAA